MERIKIIVPNKRSCPFCGVEHKPEEPHELGSLLYQNEFYKRFKRLPTAKDAESHCE